MTCPSLEPADVLDFWFRERPADAEAAMPQLRRWFQGGPDVDREIVARFAPAVGTALGGGFTSWEAEPRGRLALILLLDQFTRSVHRDDPRSVAGDARAQRLALEMLDRGLDRGLDFWERLFVDMPLRHAEDAGLQRRALAAARQLVADAPPGLASVAAMAVEQSEKYLAIVTRFGRFPHRNRLLGRPSTPEEEAFLVDWLEKAPPRAMST
jgi:uncharacterized protein (DUF924 family)